MTYIGRQFCLSEVADTGIACGEKGVFIATVPLLERLCGAGPGGHDDWQPRQIEDLNRELSECYGLPIEFGSRIRALRAIAYALARGNFIHARIATLHLQMPDPPKLAKLKPSPFETIELVRQLKASGLLKADWDPAKHPRWPAGSPGRVGGEFAPADADSGDSASEQQATSEDVVAPPHAPLIPAQITIPVPFELPDVPAPAEILPPPAIPDISPRDLPRNPYPDRPECEHEWAEATDYCLKLKARNLLGRGDYRGSGKTLSQCIMGRVSQDCGGNSTGA